MLRKIIRPQGQQYTLYIPKEYLNQKIEILILPITDEEDQMLTEAKQKKDIIAKTAGILKDKNIDPPAVPETSPSSLLLI